MLSLAAATARAMSGRGAAPRVSRAALLERSRLRRAPTHIARPFDPLAVVLLGLVQAFRAAVRTKMHCSDCRACAPQVAIHPSNPPIIASTLTIALPAHTVLTLPALAQILDSFRGRFWGRWCAGVVERPEEPLHVTCASRGDVLPIAASL